MDFTTDTLADGRNVRTLNIVDDFTRECVAIEVWVLAYAADRIEFSTSVGMLGILCGASLLLLVGGVAA